MGKGKGSPYLLEMLVPELIPVSGSQPTGDIVIYPAVGCHYFLPGPRLPSQPEHHRHLAGTKLYGTAW